MTTQGSVLFVDAYDSFTENITALLHQHLNVDVTLIKIDCNIRQEFEQSNEEFFASFDAIVLGPGPGSPGNAEDIGLFTAVWECAAHVGIPVLGICLGFQSLCAYYDTPVVRMSLPCHGHAKEILHADQDIFHELRNIVATCYNSLGLRLRDFKRDRIASRRSSSDSRNSVRSAGSNDSAVSTRLPVSETAHGRDCHKSQENLEVLAWDENDWVMAARHKLLPFHGFQFHPESCKSSLACQELVARWWEAARDHNKHHRSRLPSQQPRLLKSPKQDIDMHPDMSRKLLDALLTISGFCQGHVKLQSIHLPEGSSNIADLCQGISKPDFTAMLESTKRGRYSIYPFPDEMSFLLESAAGNVSVHLSGYDRRLYFKLGREDLSAVLESFIHKKSFKNSETHIPFRGGFIGFMSYEFGTASLQLEEPRKAGSSPATPEINLLWVDRSVVYDHMTGMAHVQSLWTDDPWVDAMAETLQNPDDVAPPSSTSEEKAKAQTILSSAKYSLPDHDEYISQIRACQSHLHAGNSYELCLTTEANITTPAGPYAPYLLYRNIQQHNPVPFASYLSLNKTAILSSSPEQFLSWSAEDRTIDMVPMKGTVKRTPEMTLAKATAILSSAKESAENLMIADLIRHDLYSTAGRNAKLEVVKLCDVVESETVFSLVSHIRAHVPIPADLDKNSDECAREMSKYGIRALTHTLPPGSMTGAPKKRSCEILHELEQRDRGVYSGAIGYIDVCGNGAWSVCIRSAFSNRDDNFKDETTGEERQKWRIGAGGAITVLSDEEQEWEEMMTKLNSVLRGFKADGSLWA